MLNLALKRVQSVSQFFDIPSNACEQGWGVVDGKKNLPFAGSTLHRLPAELAARCGPLTTRTCFWSVLTGRIAPNLLFMSKEHQVECAYCAPSCAGIRRRPATLLTACDLDR